MRRVSANLTDIAAYDNLLLATSKAIRGKRQRDDVLALQANLSERLNQLSLHIRENKLPYNRYTSFHIHDPKPRLIHAACLSDRIFHHAVMNKIGPHLDRAMSHNSFACRTAKGLHKAIQAVQVKHRRYAYFCKIDIAGYFAHIDHAMLLRVLQTKLKGDQLMSLLSKVIDGYHATAGKGLPIGSLTSQYFANLYLDGFDRFLEESTQVKGHVRYMDDIIWWCDSKAAAQQSLASSRDWLAQQRALSVKPSVQIGQTSQTVLYCGSRVSRWAVLPSRRRKRRFQQRLQFWHKRYVLGEISHIELQQAYASVASIVAHTQCLVWRRKKLNQLGLFTL